MTTINLSQMVLLDRWPGPVNPNLGIPCDGWDNTTDNFSTMDDTAKALDPPYNPGTKIMAYTDNTNCPGWYTMMYLARHEYSSECISSDFSEANIFCSPVGLGCATHSALYTDASVAPYYVVGQCYTTVATDVTKGSPVAIACTTTDADSSIALTTDPRANGYGHAWGWFWVGGVCPCKDITLLKGLGDSLLGADITTDADQRRGALYPCFTGATMIPATDMTIYGDSSYAINNVQPFGWACASGA